MLKNISRLEVKVNDKTYHFSCDMDSPLEHVKESLFQFNKYIALIEDQARASQEKAAEEQANIKEDKIEQIG